MTKTRISRIKDYDEFMEKILQEVNNNELYNNPNTNNAEFLGDYDLEKYKQHYIEEINEE